MSERGLMGIRLQKGVIRDQFIEEGNRGSVYRRKDNGGSVYRQYNLC